VEGLLKDGQVWFVDGAQVLRCHCEDEIVGSSDISQDKGRAFDVSMGGDGLVDHLEGAVCGLLAVVGCGCKAEDYQPVRRRIRLWEDRLLPGLLFAPDLRKLLHLLLCYLCVGWCGSWGGFLGGRWLLA